MLRWSLLVPVMLVSALSVAAEPPSFDDWLAGVRSQAIEQGLSEQVVTQALTDIEPDPRVIRFDRNQPEFVQSFEEYLDQRVSSDKIAMAREHYQQALPRLQAIADHYGVDPEYLISFWGLESSFGRYQGKYSVVRSLATLGYDPRRSEFFTRQLFAALKILDEGHVATPDELVGGWAGAMGQNQFIPTSFLNYAQDFDGDGRKNIWTSQDDVWASIAYYLQSNNWQQGAVWGDRVEVPAGFDFESLMPDSLPTGCRALRYHTRRMSIEEWQSRGVVPDKELSGQYALLVPAKGEQTSYLVGGNFRAILSYNCANKYAVSVGLLADEVTRDQ